MPLKLPENKVIITVAQTGALVSKQMNPNVPEQPDEIIESSYACYNEGRRHRAHPCPGQGR